MDLGNWVGFRYVNSDACSMWKWLTTSWLWKQNKGAFENQNTLHGIGMPSIVLSDLWNVSNQVQKSRSEIPDIIKWGLHGFSIRDFLVWFETAGFPCIKYREHNRHLKVSCVNIPMIPCVYERFSYRNRL